MNSRPRKGGKGEILKIRLDLNRHCVETACRRRYNRAISAYFADPQHGEHLAPEIDLLQHALKEIDFGALRRDHKALCGRHAGCVLLGQEEDRFILWIDGETVETQRRPPRA